MIFRFFFTQEGKTNERGLLLNFYKTVQYHSDDWVFDIEKLREVHFKLYYIEIRK